MSWWDWCCRQWHGESSLGCRLSGWVEVCAFTVECICKWRIGIGSLPDLVMAGVRSVWTSNIAPHRRLQKWFEGSIDIPYWIFKQAIDANTMCACMPQVCLTKVIEQDPLDTLCLMLCGTGVGLALGVRVRVLGLGFIAPFYREPLHFSRKCDSGPETATFFNFLPFSIENSSIAWFGPWAHWIDRWIVNIVIVVLVHSQDVDQQKAKD